MITNLLEKLIARRLVLPNVWFRPFLKDDAMPKLGWFPGVSNGKKCVQGGL